MLKSSPMTFKRPRKTERMKVAGKIFSFNFKRKKNFDEDKEEKEWNFFINFKAKQKKTRWWMGAQDNVLWFQLFFPPEIMQKFYRFSNFSFFCLGKLFCVSFLSHTSGFGWFCEGKFNFLFLKTFCENYFTLITKLTQIFSRENGKREKCHYHSDCRYLLFTAHSCKENNPQGCPGHSSMARNKSSPSLSLNWFTNFYLISFSVNVIGVSQNRFDILSSLLLTRKFSDFLIIFDLIMGFIIHSFTNSLIHCSMRVLCKNQ